MTRKEAAGVIKFEKACVLRQDTPRCNRDCKKCDLLLPTEDVLTAYDMAIKALEQEPKTGHWKSYTHSAYHGIDDDGEPIWREVKVYHCNLCNRRTVIKENYCPNCGCRMVKPQESEYKLDGDPIDIDKAVEHYEGTLETLKGIDLEVGE